MQEDSLQLTDDEILAAPLDLKLVILQLWPPDKEEDQAFVLACAKGRGDLWRHLFQEIAASHQAHAGCLEEVQRRLERPHDPNCASATWLSWVKRVQEELKDFRDL